MAPSLNPSKRQFDDLTIILGLSDGLSKAVDSIVNDSKKVALSPEQLEHRLQDSTKWDDQTRKAVLSQILSLSGLMMQAQLTSETVLEGLTIGIERSPHSPSWSKDDKNKWKKNIVPQLKRLLDSKLFRVASKSLNLSYDYAYLLQGVRILTDVRPVFDDEANEIDGAVISHVLRLNYDSRDSELTLSIVVDAKDLERIREECDRAIKKGILTQEWLSKGKKIPCHISGDSTSSSQD